MNERMPAPAVSADSAESAASMVPAYTAAAVRAAEEPLLAAGEPLMARAAAAVADVVRELRSDSGGPVLVLAGRGNNGGDALYAAAALAAEGVEVDLLLTSDGAHTEALGAARRAGATCVGLDRVRGEASGYSVVVDGILGIGTSFNPALRGVARATVESVLPLLSVDGVAAPRVVAVDLPSGLHPDDGTADDSVLPADVTVTFGGVKAGLVRGRGPALAGQIRLVDLGIGAGLAIVRPEIAVSGPVVIVAA